jgi:hypothetical protein
MPARLYALPDLCPGPLFDSGGPGRSFILQQAAAAVN